MTSDQLTVIVGQEVTGGANPGPEGLPTRGTCGRVLQLNWWQIKLWVKQISTILRASMTLSILLAEAFLSAPLPSSAPND